MSAHLTSAASPTRMEQPDVTMPHMPQQPTGEPAVMYVPKFFVKQRITVMVNRYEVRIANPDGTDLQLLYGALYRADESRVHLTRVGAFAADSSAEPREFDLGEFRERRRLALPLVVAVGGMVVPIAIYLALNIGRSSASGWGTALSTDTRNS